MSLFASYGSAHPACVLVDSHESDQSCGRNIGVRMKVVDAKSLRSDDCCSRSSLLSF